MELNASLNLPPLCRHSQACAAAGRQLYECSVTSPSQLPSVSLNRQLSVKGGDGCPSGPHLPRLSLPCGAGAPTDRAILWAESDSWPVRSSEPRRCTPQGRTTDTTIMNAQSGWQGTTHTKDDVHTTDHNYTKHTQWRPFIKAAGAKRHQCCWRTMLSQRQRERQVYSQKTLRVQLQRF